MTDISVYELQRNVSEKIDEKLLTNQLFVEFPTMQDE